MTTLTKKIVTSGKTGTVWFAVITVAAAVFSTPEVYQIVPPESLPYLVIFLGLLQGLKRFKSGGWDNLTVWLSAVQVFIGVLSLPQWGELLTPNGLALLASVNSAVTWWKRIFFPSDGVPTIPDPIPEGPPDVVMEVDNSIPPLNGPLG